MNARIVVVVNENSGYSLDKPLLNRHEKQALSFRSNMNAEQLALVHKLEQWMIEVACSAIHDSPPKTNVNVASSGGVGTDGQAEEKGQEADNDEEELSSLLYDAFPGFRRTNGTLLCSLVQMMTHQHRGDRLTSDQLLEKCQAQLVWAASADGMKRTSVHKGTATKTLARCEARYFSKLQCHSNFQNLFEHMLRDSVESSTHRRFINEFGMRAVILTYSDVTVDLDNVVVPAELVAGNRRVQHSAAARHAVDDVVAEEKGFEGVSGQHDTDRPPGEQARVEGIELRVDNINVRSMHGTAALKARLDHHFSVENDASVLAVHCTVGRKTARLRHMITEARKDYARKLVEPAVGTMPPGSVRHKHVVLCIHLHKGFTPAEDHSWEPFSHDWPLQFLDTLSEASPHGFDSEKLLTDSMLDVVNSSTAGKATEQDPVLAICRTLLLKCVTNLNWPQGVDTQRRMQALGAVLDNPVAARSIASVVRACLKHTDYGAGVWQLAVAADTRNLHRHGSYRAALAEAVVHRMLSILSVVLTLVELGGAAVAAGATASHEASVAWGQLLESGLPLELSRHTLRFHAKLDQLDAKTCWCDAVHDVGARIVGTPLPTRLQYSSPFFWTLVRRITRMRDPTLETHRCQRRVREAVRTVLLENELFAVFREAGTFSTPLYTLVCTDLCAWFASTLPGTNCETYSAIVHGLARDCIDDNETIMPADIIAAAWCHTRLIRKLYGLQFALPKIDCWRLEKPANQLEAMDDHPLGLVPGGSHRVELMCVATQRVMTALLHPERAQYTTAIIWSSDVFRASTCISKCVSAVRRAGLQNNVTEPAGAASNTDALKTKQQADETNLAHCAYWIRVAELLHQFGVSLAEPAAMPVRDVATVTDLVYTHTEMYGTGIFRSVEFLNSMIDVVGRLTSQAASRRRQLHTWRGLMFLNLFIASLDFEHGGLDLTIAAIQFLASPTSKLHDPRTLPSALHVCVSLRG